MATKKETTKVEESKDEKVEEVVEEPKEKGFDVVDSKGSYVRTYSKKLHGKDAENLAKQFAKKIEGDVTK